MAITLYIIRETDTPEGIEYLMQLAANALLEGQGISSAEVSVLLADNDSLRDLNRRYRGVDEPTDVLSFPAADDVIKPGTEAGYLGDIAISVPVAAQQASAMGHEVIAELQLLLIHGILHLLGHDHMTEEEKDRMWMLQRHALEQLGLDNVQPTET